MLIVQTEDIEPPKKKRILQLNSHNLNVQEAIFNFYGIFRLGAITFRL